MTAKEIGNSLYIIGDMVVYGWVITDDNEVKRLWNYNRDEDGYEILSKHSKPDLLEGGCVYIVKTSDGSFGNSKYLDECRRFEIEIEYPLTVVGYWQKVLTELNQM